MSAWLDKYELKVGDSLRRSIDQGLLEAQFGVVVLSEAFFAPHKKWTQLELDGLFALEDPPDRVILPVWHGIDERFLKSRSPLVAAKLGSLTNRGIEATGAELLDAIHRHRRQNVPSFVHLRHLDDPDPVSLKLWLTQIYAGKPDVRLIWPEEINWGLRQISKAAEELESVSGDEMRIRSSGKTIRSMDADSLLTGRAYAEKAMIAIARRLPLLVQSTMRYDGPHYYVHERILKAYLRQAYAWIWDHVASLLNIIDSARRPVGHGSSDQVRYAARVDVTLVRARTKLENCPRGQLLSASEILGTYSIWAPEYLWPQTQKTNGMVGADLFELYLVPQTELELARRDSSAETLYDPHNSSWWFRDFKDEHGKWVTIREIIPPSFQ